MQACRYLLGKGHRRIAFVQNSAAGDLSALERRDGYIEALREAGLEPWVFVPSTDCAPFEAGKQAMQALIRRDPRPEAIIFANDNLAAGALLAGQRAGLRLPRTWPSSVLATTLRRDAVTQPDHLAAPSRQIGELAAMRVLQHLGCVAHEGEVERLNLLQCELITRESA